MESAAYESLCTNYERGIMLLTAYAGRTDLRLNRSGCRRRQIFFLASLRKSSGYKSKTREKRATPVYRATLSREKFIFGLDGPAWANSILSHNKALGMRSSTKLTAEARASYKGENRLSRATPL